MKLIVLLLLVSFSAMATTINGLYVNTFGNPKGQPIIFIHGGPGFNSFNFEFSTAQVLADKGFYVVVYDQRGSGRSSSTTIDQFRYEKSFNDLNSILDSLNISRTILIGHSFGGTLAIKYAQKNLDKIKSIFLVSAPIDQPEMVASILNNCEKNYQKTNNKDALQYLESIKNFVYQNGKYQINAEYGGYLFAHAIGCGLYNPDVSNENQQNIWKKLFTLPDSKLLSDSKSLPFQGFIQNENWLSENNLSTLKSLQTPVYGIFGKNDGLFNKKQFVDLSAIIGVDNLMIVEHASHNVFIDQQNDFLNFLLKKIKN